MEHNQQLADRFEEVLLSGTWIANTNYRDQLINLSWETATAKVNSLNSIAVLAQHIHYYVRGINNVFTGGTLDIKDKFSFDFPAIKSQDEWEAFLSKFWTDAAEFISLVKQLPPEKFDHFFTDEKYGTYLRNIDGMIEHSYYHLGQIVLLKKILSAATY
jgi:uncharacterized damage-inducible protein DinB